MDLESRQISYPDWYFKATRARFRISLPKTAQSTPTSSSTHCYYGRNSADYDHYVILEHPFVINPLSPPSSIRI